MIREIELSTPQVKVINCRKPLLLNMAGQRSGKTFIMGFKSGRYIQNAPKIAGMIAANTYKQLTQTTLREIKKVWKSIYGITEYDSKSNPGGDFVVNHIPPAHFNTFEKFSEYYGIISFKNGAIVFIASLENYIAHDGKNIGWALLDETKDTREDALKAVILARLSQPGFLYNKENLEINYVDDVLNDPDDDIKNYIEWNPCDINTSPSIGVVKWLTDMFNLEIKQKDILKALQSPSHLYFEDTESYTVCISSTHHNAHNLSKNYIENRLANLSESEGLKFVYGFPFARTGDSFYRNFSQDSHVDKVFYNPELPIHLTYDFNAKPYMTKLCAQVEPNDLTLKFEIRFFKEYCLSSPYNSTEAVCDRFLEDYEDDDPMIFFYGDASGDYRQAGSGDFTQFDTVRDKLKNYISTSSDKVPPKNKGVFNRRDFVDRILERKLVINYNGLQYTVIIVIDPECEELIADMQWLKEGVDGKFKEKVKDEATGETYEKYGHTSDAMEYLIVELLEDYYQK